MTTSSSSKQLMDKRLVLGISAHSIVPNRYFKASANSPALAFNPAKVYKATFTEEFPTAQPGIISTNDKTSIAAIDMLQEVISAERIANVLTNACRYKPTDRIDFGMRINGKQEAQREVVEFQEADITKTPPTRVDFKLIKNMVHVAASDESQMTNETIMTLYDNLMDCGAALAATKDELIAEALLSGTQRIPIAAGQKWTTSTVNPYTVINQAFKRIRKAECGTVNVAVANSDVWSAFFALDKVNGVLKGVEPHLTQSSFTVPTLPGVTCLSTDRFEGDDMVLANKRLYTVLAQGPRTIEDYRASTAGYDGWLFRDYMQAQIAIDKAGIILENILN
jgi:hypothetical protein